MELALTDDQALFHETTVRFVEAESPIEAVRALHDDPLGYDRGWFSRAAQLGWFSMLVPEGDGGGRISDAGLVDATIVAEELGRHVQPGPFIPMNVVADALVSSGTPDQRAELLPSLVAGEVVATWAFAAANGAWDEGAGLTATPTSDGFRLDGARGFVQDAVGADLVLVVAHLDGKPVELLVPITSNGVIARGLACLDLSRRLASLTFDAVEVPATAQLGSIDSTPEALERQLDIALALAAAETVGAMDALFTMTVQYAKDRIAFGRPIGSFQALKHVLADAAVELETCKAGAVALARAVAAKDEDAPKIASMVTAYIAERSDQLAQVSLQLHGGIGYTWEHDVHLFMRRIRTNAVLYGDASWHRERVCALYGLGEG